jgi:hypothetical protein
MRSRDRGDKRPCEVCGIDTMFQLPLHGPRGGFIRNADVCPSCGEQPALTAELGEQPPTAAREAEAA